MTIADLIQGPRQGAGLSQRRLATLSGVPQPSIAELESGAQADATIGLVDRLLSACNSQLVTIPTRTPTVAASAAFVRRALRDGRTGFVRRQLLQVNDDLASEHPSTRLALTLTPPALTGHPGVDAFFAAVVEHQLRPARLPVPAWTSQPERFCDPPWDAVDIPSLTDDIRRSTPPAFRRHGVLISKEDLTSV